MNDLTPLYTGIGVFLGFIGFAVFLDIISNDGDSISKIFKSMRGK